MRHVRTTGALTLAVAGAAVVSTLLLPAAASADPGFGGPGPWVQPGGPGPAGPRQGGPGPGGPGPGGPERGGPGAAPASWNHPEWGAGWNNGFPQQGWIPPDGWQAPQGWTNPTGWQPPQGWCSGPINGLIHPICWFLPH